MFGALLPEGFAMQWEAHTPYFADGDPVRFRVDDPTIFRVPEKSDEIREKYVERVENMELPYEQRVDLYLVGRYGQSETIKYPNGSEYTYDAKPLVDGLSRETVLKINELWKSLPKDLIERVFGDPARVTVFSGGRYVVNEYDHD